MFRLQNAFYATSFPLQSSLNHPHQRPIGPIDGQKEFSACAMENMDSFLEVLESDGIV